MIIDTHCHIFHSYYTKIDDIVNNYEEAGIKYVINNAVNYETILEVLEISKKYKSILPAIGYQPEEIKKNLNFDIIEQNIDKIVAVGEIGLDLHYQSDNISEQIYAFEKQLKLAEKYNKPVIIHSRDAFEQTIEILKKYKVQGVWHCFTGNINEANEILNLGFKLGIGGILTFKNSNLRKTVEQLNLEDIVLETDSPYLSPTPLRGKKNEPKNIVYVFKEICKIKGVDEKKASEIINNNVFNIFDI